MAKTLIIIGALLIIAGVAWHFGAQAGFGKWIGRLPGDITVERPGFRFYFPLATSLLLSVLLSVIMYLINRFWR